MQHPFIEKVLSSLSSPSALSDAGLEATLLEPYTYLASSPGERAPSEFTYAFNDWLQVPLARLAVLSRPLKLIFTACFLLDDIEDGSELRRGKPAAHKIFGVPQTINSANYVYFLAYQELFKMTSLEQGNNPSVSGVASFQRFNDEILAVHRGQGMELFWRDHFQCPTEEEYVQMVKGKVGGPLRSIVKLMIDHATANADKNYIPLIDLLSIWMQIRDDYINLQSEKYAKVKGFAEDLSEGKFSFPIIHGIREKPDNKYVMSVLRRRTNNETLKRDVVSYLKDVTRSFEYTLTVLRLLEAQVRAEVAKLGGNPKLEAMVDRLSEYDSLH